MLFWVLWICILLCACASEKTRQKEILTTTCVATVTSAATTTPAASTPSAITTMSVMTTTPAAAATSATTTASVAIPEEAVGERRWITASSVNFRKSPEADAAVLRRLSRGTEVRELGRVGDWVHVRCERQQGYVHKDYVSDREPPKETATKTVPTDTVPRDESSGEQNWITGSSVNFRKTPDADGEVIRKLNRGTEIIKLRTAGEWVYIELDMIRGYVHQNYISDTKPPKIPEGKASIVVKKGERLLELWKGGIMVDSYSIGLGWAPNGHKQVEGDGKTPEGEYYVCVKNYNSAFYLSLGVSYPNKKDAAAALEDGRINRATYDRIAHAIDDKRQPDWNTALGGAIMIHGCGGSSDWTAGCIAVDDEVMDILFEHCSVGTKITILP